MTAKDKLTTSQITDILSKEIEDMDYSENDKFSTEREIMERFSISRMTARQALNFLVAKGILYRIKGRGAFVNKRIIQRSHTIYSFTELMKESGMAAGSKLIELKKVIPPEIARLNLAMSEGEFCYLIKRIRLADDEPYAYEMIYTPVSLVPNLDEYDLEKDSFYRILQQEYHKEFSYDKKTISAVKIDGEVSQALYNNDYAIALKILDILYDVNHNALEYAESWYHAEKYSYLSISVKK